MTAACFGHLAMASLQRDDPIKTEHLAKGTIANFEAFGALIRGNCNRLTAHSVLEAEFSFCKSHLNQERGLKRDSWTFINL